MEPGFLVLFGNPPKRSLHVWYHRSAKARSSIIQRIKSFILYWELLPIGIIIAEGVRRLTGLSDKDTSATVRIRAL